MKLALLLAAMLAAFVTILPAQGHDHGGKWSQLDPGISQWLRSQKVPPGNGALSGFSCCDERDGDEVEEDIRDGHYWIRGAHFPDWTPVPDSLVIREPNKYGQPTVWWVSDGGTGGYAIRCFAPGALI